MKDQAALKWFGVFLLGCVGVAILVDMNGEWVAMQIVRAIVFVLVSL